MRLESFTTKFLRHVQCQPDNTAFTILSYANDESRITYRELDESVRSLASVLIGKTNVGDTVCLVYPHGLDFVVGFLACLRVGVVAVPCSVPKKQNHRSYKRLTAIILDAEPKLLLTHSSLETALRISEVSKDVGADRLEVVATDALHIAPTEDAVLREGEIAFLQYTSGSTGTPKGVVVTNQNLAANEDAIRQNFQHSADSVMVSWLPMYHDMGLIGGVLQPLYVGFPAVLLSPELFLSRPVRWLEAVDRFGGTTTGAPNFAYDLCTQQIDDDDLQRLDLSSLQVAYNGSEPVRSGTLDRFAGRFKRCGFRADAFFPCYGMSETTLLVSGGPPNRAVPRTTNPNLELKTVIGCGKPAAATTVAIVDPDTHGELPVGEVGEIWVKGASVAAGYWKKPHATQEFFQANIQGDATSRSFLRTGDLGFVDGDGELYICGRIKDVIIVGGRNIYPQDIEATVEETLDLGSKFRTIAIRSDATHRELVSLGVECNSELRKFARSHRAGMETDSEIELQARKLRAAVATEFEVAVDRIAFLKTGTLPKTTSGKVKRSALRKILAESNENLLYVSESEIAADGSEADVHDRVKNLVHEVLSGACSTKSAMSLDELGLDSLGKQSVVAEIERRYHIRFDDAAICGSRTIGDIVGLVQHQKNGRSGTGAAERPVDSKLTSLTDFAQRESRDLLAKTNEFRLWLDDAESRGFKRYLLPVIEQRGGRALVGRDRYSPEREVILFGSADYLGLAHDPRVKQAAADAILEHGCNVASVPLVAGSTPMHSVLESQLAELLGHEGCVLFPTGHSANMATIAALCSQHDTVVVDNRVHYSILEGVRLAHAPWRTFLHNSPENLRTTLESVRKTNRNRGLLVVLEGVYGIEGDLADMDGLISVAREFDARVMLDDAHGIGVLGKKGEGTAVHKGAEHRADIVMGSLSKSLGSFGGFIVGSRDTVDYLRFYAKAISFAVGMPIVNCAGALKAMEIIRNEPERMSDLRIKARFFRDALVNEGFAEAAISESTIMSSTVGSEELLRDVIKELFDHGVWAEGLPFPAVSRGQERVRFRVRSEHTMEDLTEAARITGETCRRIMPRRLSVPGTNVGAGKVVLSQLTQEQAKEICNLGIEQAERLDTSLPWVSREFITKYLMRDEYWKHAEGENEWHLSYNGGRIVSAFALDRTRTFIDGRQSSTTLLGAFVVKAGYEERFLKQLAEVIKSEATKSEFVVAPASHPVQVFGSGIQDWHAAGGKPFLEASLPTSLTDALCANGLTLAGEKKYYRVGIDSHAAAPLTEGLTIRDFRRASYLEEIDILAPIMDQTLGRLDLCAPIDKSILRGLIQDLRELVLPGFWLMAEMNGEPAAFAFCYPNITAEFRRIAGAADVADYQLMQQSMETADEAFLAWLGVAPKFANQGVAQGLVGELRGRLLDRGYKRLWMSWELIDGETPIVDLVRSVGKIDVEVGMPYFATVGHKPMAIPAPHFVTEDATVVTP